MNETNYIVVSDPSPDICDLFREGDVLDAARARQWEPAGVLLLPVHAPHLPQRGGVGSLASTAYQRHAYGGDGVLFDGARFQRGCAVPVCMPTSTARIEWMAKIAWVGDEANASLRLVPEETSHGTLRISEAQFGPRVASDILRGSVVIEGGQRCFGAVCLAGACVGVRVLWFAVTVLPR